MRRELASCVPRLNIHFAHVCRCSAAGPRESRLINLIPFWFESGSCVRGEFNVTFVGVLIVRLLSPLNFLLLSRRRCVKGPSVFSNFVSYLHSIFFYVRVNFCFYSAVLKTQQTLPFNRLFNDGVIKLAPALIPRLLTAFHRRRDELLRSYREVTLVLHGLNPPKLDGTHHKVPKPSLSLILAFVNIDKNTLHCVQIFQMLIFLFVEYFKHRRL